MKKAHGRTRRESDLLAANQMIYPTPMQANTMPKVGIFWVQKFSFNYKNLKDTTFVRQRSMWVGIVLHDRI